MQLDENAFEFENELFQLDPHIEHTLSEVQYSQNYIDVLGDLVETFPLYIPSIARPYDKTHDEKEKIQVTCKYLKQVKRLKNRKRLLLIFFFLEQLLAETSLSTQEVSNLRVTKHIR